MKVIFVQGATATGKTQLAINLALELGGPAKCSIISCDSIQVYKHLEIGTAKPSEEQLAQIPHHLISIVDYPAEYTAGEFRRDALEILEKLKLEKKEYVFVVGGTGFYFQALEKGMHDFPPTPIEVREAVEQDLQTKGLNYLYAELQQQDPAYAAKINANDNYRVTKAVEILRSQGKPSEIRAQFKADDFPYDLLKIALDADRELLLPYIEKRTDAMFDNGLVDECKKWIYAGYSEWAPMLSVGYVETQDFIHKKTNFETCRNDIITHTWQLAKRQRTWFKRDNATHFFRAHQFSFDKVLNLVGNPDVYKKSVK